MSSSSVESETTIEVDCDTGGTGGVWCTGSATVLVLAIATAPSWASGVAAIVNRRSEIKIKYMRFFGSNKNSNFHVLLRITFWNWLWVWYSSLKKMYIYYKSLPTAWQNLLRQTETEKYQLENIIENCHFHLLLQCLVNLLLQCLVNWSIGSLGHYCWPVVL